MVYALQNFQSFDKYQDFKIRTNDMKMRRKMVIGVDLNFQSVYSARGRHQYYPQTRKVQSMHFYKVGLTVAPEQVRNSPHVVQFRFDHVLFRPESLF